MPLQTYTIAGIDLHGLGFKIERVDGWLDGPDAVLSMIDLPGRAGSVITGYEESRGKLLRAIGTLQVTSLAARLDLIDLIKDAVYNAGPLWVQRVDTPQRGVWAKPDGSFAVQEDDPQLVTSGPTGAKIIFGLRTLSSYLQDAIPLPYGFDGTPTPIPVGTADVMAWIRIYGPGNILTLSSYDAQGGLLTATQFNNNLGVNDWLDIDCLNNLSKQNAAGATTDSENTILGDPLPRLTARYADRVGGVYPMLKVTAFSGGQPTGEAYFARRWR